MLRCILVNKDFHKAYKMCQFWRATLYMQFTDHDTNSARETAGLLSVSVRPYGTVFRIMSLMSKLTKLLGCYQSIRYTHWL